MIAVLSPAKNMKMEKCHYFLTRPSCIEQSQLLYNRLKEFSPWELESILQCNSKIAFQAFLDYQNFDFKKEGTGALFAFQGLLYQNISPKDFTQEDINFAQEHLRMLSAFYGILKPCDGILPYRLEMQSKLKIEEKGLYTFWGKSIYEQLFQYKKPVINLSSAEYTKLIQPYVTERDCFITCKFLTYKKGKYSMIPTMAKMARGQMARFIIKNKIETPEGIKAFSWEDFTYSQEWSDEKNYVFLQDMGLEGIKIVGR